VTPPPLVPVGGGALALTHRPKRKALAAWKASGVTHVVTLLTEREGARDIGAAVADAGVSWLWIPMDGAKVPDAARTEELLPALNEVAAILARGGCVVVHCSAGIHRTGMFGYALLRRLGLVPEEAHATLVALRAETAAGVGAERLAWGDNVARARR
jgi:protein-tyrosine phosphatase